tara:strand:- start:14292 stop:14789 length:498 start_codon:yes stop_codon:yes gene_type:complete
MSWKPELPGVYQGKQILITSDRLVFNAKNDSILLYSNEGIGFSTEGSIHFDTSDFTGNKFIVNAPEIYLGLNYDGELPPSPAVKGYELGEYLGGTDGVLSVIEDLIDVVCDGVAYTSPFSDPISGRTQYTAPNRSNYGMFSHVLNRIKALKKDVEDFKSKKTKIA